jgi:hypothetical protein
MYEVVAVAQLSQQNIIWEVCSMLTIQVSTKGILNNKINPE